MVMKMEDDRQKNINIEFSDPSEEEKQNVSAEEGSNQDTVSEGEKSLEERLKAYEQRIAELEDQNLRLKAEFANFRKRIEKEQLEFADYIKGELIKKLLPVLDDFKMMLDKVEAGQNEQSVLEGAKMIYQKMLQILEKEGLQKIESLGKEFNPEEHEALMMRETEEEHQHEKIVEVYQEGFKLKDRLLRPSKVVVGKFENNHQN